MTEAEWLASEDPAAMLDYLTRNRNRGIPDRRYLTSNIPSDRKLRLFVCACARVGAPGTFERSYRPTEDDPDTDRWTGIEDHDLARFALKWCSRDGIPGNVPQAYKVALLRDIVGNPFAKPVQWVKTSGWRQTETVSHVYLDEAIRTPTVLSLAQAAYDERWRGCRNCSGRGWYRDGHQYNRTKETCAACHGTGRPDDGTLDPDRLAVLSDALEEAGCDNQELLMHLRGWAVCRLCNRTGRTGEHLQDKCDDCNGFGWDILRGPHYRGCWAIDLILGRE